MKKLNPNSVFASNVDRFQKPENKFQNPMGPGSYDIDKKMYEKQKLPKIITIRQGNRKVKPKSNDRPLPGPGYYETSNATIFRQLEDKGNNGIVSKE